MTEKGFCGVQKPVGAMWKVSGVVKKGFRVTWKAFSVTKKGVFERLKVGEIGFSKRSVLRP
ncbi:MAG TPA: hypothetical protein DC054_02045 [Blastocatellia bacterium]|nr:hypothetical protein [Blastocatellia bacterium]